MDSSDETNGVVSDDSPDGHRIWWEYGSALNRAPSTSSLDNIGSDISWSEKWSEIQELVDGFYKSLVEGLYFLFSNKLLQITCTIIITLIVLVLVSLIFWRYRVYYYNQFLGLQKSVHQWRTFESSSNPRYCSVCRQLVSGFWIYRNTGCECTICARTSHLNCLSGCERLECKTPCQPHPLTHKFVHGNLGNNSVCCVCGIICSSNFGLNGIRCLWCNRTLHQECAKYLADLCDLGPFNRLIVPPVAVELSMTLQRSAQQASSKYVEFMGSHLREGFQQVQEQMTAGFREGMKEVSLGMKRINQAIKKQFATASLPPNQPVHNDSHSKPSSVENDAASGISAAGFLINSEELLDDPTATENNIPLLLRDNQTIPSASDTNTANKPVNSELSNDGSLSAPSVCRRNISSINRKTKMFELAKMVPAKADVWSLVDQPHLLLTHPSATPLLIFVNAKSGGQMGAALLREFYNILNPIQVVDIQSEKGPVRSLEQFRALWRIRRLRVLVCGGDGTVGWVMDEIYNTFGAEGHFSVPLGILPLGTGNDLSKILGWGADFNGDVKDIKEHLMKTQAADTLLLDVWEAKGFDDKGIELFRKSFQNYMDVGVAARIALRFHELRESHPELFQSRLGNKFLYGEVGVREFLVNPNMVMKGLRVWCDEQEVPLPEMHIEGLCTINIQAFAGGVKLWKDCDAPNGRSDIHSKVSRTFGNSSRRSAVLERRHVNNSEDESDIAYESDDSASLGLSHRRYANSLKNNFHDSIAVGPSKVSASVSAPHFPNVTAEDIIPRSILGTHQGIKGCKHWKNQSINDQIIEVVAFRSLFHLAQVQVGLAEPIRVCQGSQIKIDIPEDIPFQVDGEAQMLKPCSLIVSHKCVSPVLTPSGNQQPTESLKIVYEVLDNAFHRGTINMYQKLLLEQEFQKRRQSTREDALATDIL